MKLYAHTNGGSYEIHFNEEMGHCHAVIGRQDYIIDLDDQSGAVRTAFLSGGKSPATKKIEFGWTRKKNSYQILIDGIVYDVEIRDARAERAASLSRVQKQATGAVEVRAPIPGQISRILLRPGTRVKERQPVLILDAMKLENEIQAPRDGVLQSISVAEKNAVEKGQLLFVIL